ncbi:MAG TPA: type II toxin-antitoxin system HipA family toxin [Solirubrobacteraceae bacterium]|jgi:serine/threonine-protein kinase HipA
MSDSLLVILDDVVAGALTRLPGGRLRFDYDAAYREQRGHTPLSLSMPIQVSSHTHQQIDPWLWGLLPDNDAVLRRWAREFQVSPSSAFSLLSTPIGEDCAGAVRFAPPGELERVLGRGGEVTWLDEDQVAQRLRELREDSTAWLGRSFTGQFSLAGAQAKTALLLDDDRWGVPSGPIPTTHILKPAVTGFDDHDLNEHLCLEAARRARLVAARSTIARFADETAVVVTRYDRLKDGEGVIMRVHQEDLCQALGMPPSQKYQNEGGPTPAQIARLLRDAMPPRIGEDAVWRFADALIWNWLIAGTDAHAKNYSLLLAGDQVRLAPLYDIASALPYGTHERKLKLAMKIGSSYEVYPQRNRWPHAARDLGLDAEALVDRARELAAVTPEAFAAAVGAPEVRSLNRDLPARLLDLVADRARRCLEILTPTSASSC